MDLTEFLTARLDEDETWASDPVRGGADWVPPRMLREVAAKRAILAEHRHQEVQPTQALRGGFGCTICHEQDMITLPNGWCVTLRALAAVWSDHPDYDPAWA